MNEKLKEVFPPKILEMILSKNLELYSLVEELGYKEDLMGWWDLLPEECEEVDIPHIWNDDLIRKMNINQNYWYKEISIKEHGEIYMENHIKIMRKQFLEKLK